MQTECHSFPNPDLRKYYKNEPCSIGSGRQANCYNLTQFLYFSPHADNFTIEVIKWFISNAIKLHFNYVYYAKIKRLINVPVVYILHLRRTTGEPLLFRLIHPPNLKSTSWNSLEEMESSSFRVSIFFISKNTHKLQEGGLLLANTHVDGLKYLL